MAKAGGRIWSRTWACLILRQPRCRGYAVLDVAGLTKVDANTADQTRLITGKVKALPRAMRRLSSVAAPQAVYPSGRSNARSSSRTEEKRAGASAKQRC
eukprot:12233234-Karenia_brevis.AAC.1